MKEHPSQLVGENKPMPAVDDRRPEEIEKEQEEEQEEGQEPDKGPIPTPAGLIGRNAQFRLEEEEIEKIQEAIAKIGPSGGKVKITRRAPGEMSFKLIGEESAAEFELQAMIDLYGGGDYLLQFCTNKGLPIARVPVGVDKSVRPKNAERENPNYNNISEVLKILKDNKSNGDVERLMSVNMQRSDQFFQNMMAMQEKNMQNMIAMLGALNGGSKGPGESLSQLITAVSPLLVPVIQRMISEKKQDNQILRSMEDVQKMMDLLSSKDDKGGGLEKYMPLLAGLFGGLGQRQQVAPQSHQLPPHQQTDSSMNSTPAQPAPQMQEALIPPHARGILVKFSNNGTPFPVVCEMIDTVLDEDQKDQVYGALFRDDWLHVLFGEDPAVMNRANWFEGLRKELLTFWGDEDTQPEQAPDNPDAEVTGEIDDATDQHSLQPTEPGS